jgi:hypothetical protein
LTKTLTVAVAEQSPFTLTDPEMSSTPEAPATVLVWLPVTLPPASWENRPTEAAGTGPAGVKIVPE